jgi:hypothetical protein
VLTDNPPKGNTVNKKLFSATAIALSLVAGSAFAAADGPDYNVAAAQSTVSRAEVSAQGVQAQREAHDLYGNADGNLDVTVADVAPVRARDEVKAETIASLRVGHDLVNTPY